MKRKTVDKPVESVYNLILNMNGTRYESSGTTLIEAFSALGLDFQQIKTKGEIIVRKEGKEANRLIQLPKLRRYFLSKLLLSGLIRDFERLLV